MDWPRQSVTPLRQSYKIKLSLVSRGVLILKTSERAGRGEITCLHLGQQLSLPGKSPVFTPTSHTFSGQGQLLPPSPWGGALQGDSQLLGSYSICPWALVVFFPLGPSPGRIPPSFWSLWAFSHFVLCKEYSGKKNGLVLKPSNENSPTRAIFKLDCVAICLLWHSLFSSLWR